MKILRNIGNTGKHYNNLKKETKILCKVFETPIFNEVAKVCKQNLKPKKARIKGKYSGDTYNELLENYSKIPHKTSYNPKKTYRNICQDLLGGVPLWKSPELQYNVGAATNPVSSALYSTALDLNIFNINDGLSGNTIIAEQAVTRALSTLAKVPHEQSCGFFTFGGTATNLYAIKLAISKNFPNTRRDGLPKNIKIAITEDAHFSHHNSLNWLGIGTNNAITLPALNDRTTDLTEAEKKLKEVMKKGYKIPLIILNGGTTYDNAIDDIAGFANLRDKLVKECKLDYTPQIHVDAVIGWSWLSFAEYDFSLNKLGIPNSVLERIEKQYLKIKQVKKADSWGVDFHKGIGACPVPSSVFMVNDKSYVPSLSYDEEATSHQLAREFSKFSPADFTLETSRPAGAALAALGSLQTLGLNGLRTHLANLIHQNYLFREHIINKNRSDVLVVNKNSPGFVTMIRLLKPKNKYNEDSLMEKESNKYLKSFFEFDLKDRISKGVGVEYSYSSQYTVSKNENPLAAIKFYPTSPFIKSKNTIEAASTLLKQKDIFDSKDLSN